MKTKILDLVEENLKDIPEWHTHPFSCKYCIYWEFPCSEKEKKEDALEMKLGWLKNTKRIFGNCGKLIYVDGKCIGYAQYALPEFLPNSKNYSITPSEDAVFISCLFIPQKEFRNLGLGTLLLKSIIDELGKGKTKTVETFARKGNSENSSGPVEFYLKNGFKVYKDDKEFPLMKLDL